MDEFCLIHRTTGEERPAFGYDYRDACRRFGLDPAEWIVLNVIHPRDYDDYDRCDYRDYYDYDYC